MTRRTYGQTVDSPWLEPHTPQTMWIKDKLKKDCLPNSCQTKCPHGVICNANQDQFLVHHTYHHFYYAYLTYIYLKKNSYFSNCHRFSVRRFSELHPHPIPIMTSRPLLPAPPLPAHQSPNPLPLPAPLPPFFFPHPPPVI